MPVEIDQPREEHDERQSQQTSFQMSHIRFKLLQTINREIHERQDVPHDTPIWISGGKICGPPRLRHSANGLTRFSILGFRSSETDTGQACAGAYPGEKP
jgi:hypothetical protein